MGCDESFNELFHDYLALCEAYEDKMPVQEFGFGMIRLVSKMLFDMAPSEMVARETIRVGMEEGLMWSKKTSEGACDCHNKEGE